jgi:hypothetical protein
MKWYCKVDALVKFHAFLILVSEVWTALCRDICIEQGAGWKPDQVWTLWGK